MRNIFLHVGPPKTGTSAIQAFLRDNANVLRALGFHVPVTLNRHRLNHHALVRHLADLPVPPQQRIPKEEILRHLTETPAHSVLLSSELAAGILRRNPRARRLLDALSSTGARIIVVMYARNQPQLLNSGYSQVVKAFRFNGSLASFVDSALSAPGQQFDKLMAITRTCQLELRPRAYSRRVRENGIIADYLDAVGVPHHPDFRFPARVNESVGPFTIEAARRLLAGLGNLEPTLTLLQASKCKLALEQAVRELGVDDRGYCGLTSELARKIEAAFKSSNDRFAAAAWGISWEAAFPDEVGQPFTSNDYQHTGVPQSQIGALADVVGTVRSRIDEILCDEKLAARTPWNVLRTRQNKASRTADLA